MKNTKHLKDGARVRPHTQCPHSNQEEHRLYRTLILQGCGDREAWDIIREAKEDLQHDEVVEKTEPETAMDAFVRMTATMDKLDMGYRRSAVMNVNWETYTTRFPANKEEWKRGIHIKRRDAGDS